MGQSTKILVSLASFENADLFPLEKLARNTLQQWRPVILTREERGLPSLLAQINKRAKARGDLLLFFSPLAAVGWGPSSLCLCRRRGWGAEADPRTTAPSAGTGLAGCAPQGWLRAMQDAPAHEWSRKHDTMMVTQPTDVGGPCNFRICWRWKARGMAERRLLRPNSPLIREPGLLRAVLLNSA